MTKPEQKQIMAIRKLDREAASIRLLQPLTDKARKSIEERLAEIEAEKIRRGK
jgi:hypothetical protein